MYADGGEKIESVRPFSASGASIISQFLFTLPLLRTARRVRHDLAGLFDPCQKHAAAAATQC